MSARKVISKVLNIRKSSRFLWVFFFGVIGFSIGSCQYLDLPKFGKVLFTDSSVQAAPPWPD